MELQTIGLVHEFDDEGGYKKLEDEGGYEKLEDEVGLNKSDDQERSDYIIIKYNHLAPANNLVADHPPTKIQYNLLDELPS